MRLRRDWSQVRTWATLSLSRNLGACVSYERIGKNMRLCDKTCLRKCNYVNSTWQMNMPTVWIFSESSTSFTSWYNQTNNRAGSTLLNYIENQVFRKKVLEHQLLSVLRITSRGDQRDLLPKLDTIIVEETVDLFDGCSFTCSVGTPNGNVHEKSLLYKI